jgi:hypothetical protein
MKSSAGPHESKHSVRQHTVNPSARHRIRGEICLPGVCRSEFAVNIRQMKIRTIATGLLLAAALCPARGGAGTVWFLENTQEKGPVVITNIPPSGANAAHMKTIKVLHIRPKGWRDVAPGNYKLNREAFDEVIRTAARHHEVDEHLVRAVIHAESAFNPRAVSPMGASGLMQLMPGTAARFGVSDVFDPQANIAGGVQYLSFLLKLFGDTRLAVAAYNAGEGAVQRYKGIPPYEETMTYVTRVMQLYGQYRQTR